MKDTSQYIGWYEILKDIIIPLLGVLSTIVIGTIIAVLLKRKEERSKIKTLLIDNYMLYLNAKGDFFSYELKSFTYQVYKALYFNYTEFFEVHANHHRTKEIIAKRLDNLKSQLEKDDQEAGNWSPFTYRFAFLLGKSQYDKYVQQLEDEIVSKYFADKPRIDFVNELKKQVKASKSIVDDVNSSDLRKIEDALDRLEFLISNVYAEFQKKIFNPYDTRIANMIDKY